MNTCPQCSAAVTDSSVNCPACGTALAGTQATIRQPSPKASPKENSKIPTRSSSTSSRGEGSFLAGTVLGDRYRITGLLGRGGMGEVYKAEDLKLNQTVALKFLPDHFADDVSARERFFGEVRTARQVSHTNVCRVFDIGDVNGSHFLSMEFIDGDDLSSLLRRIGRIPPDKALEIARQLCAGLHAVHQAGILHRDFKPANVMIDGRGKARLTDFGIAGLESELKEGAVAGTPAYTSPEQITGKELTTKSDIYSLGLVLYEIFTGKQAFAGNTINELLRQHKTATPTTPSEVIKDIDPLVEKIILRCLEKDPGERPASALQVAMMLPGGNPLEAAIAAGETPSPEMVAAAPKKGALKPVVAVACLMGVVALFAFIVMFSGRVKLNEWVPLDKSPEVMAERSKQILNRLGYASAALHTVYSYDLDSSYLNYANRESTAPDRYEKIRTGQPVSLYFWQRTSPRYMIPNAFGEVNAFDPANDISGMTRVILDARGRLVEFQAVPPQVEEEATQQIKADWSKLFAEAGLEQGSYTEVESQWTPPFFADERKAWDGPNVDHPDIPVRIEAAAFHGKPVYFDIVFPWDRPARQTQPSQTTSNNVINIFLAVVFFSILVTALVVTRLNLKAGRGDTKGALKLGVFVFSAITLARLFDGNHVPELGGELWIIFQATSLGLFLATVTWIFYIGLEPFVRRRWSELMISWSRLIAGDFRDPLVGRDILIGGLLGLAATSIEYSRILLHQRLGIAWQANRFGTEPLSGVDGIAVHFLHMLSEPVFGTVLFSFLLLILVKVFRKKRLAIAGFWLLILVPDLVSAVSGSLLPLVGDVLVAALMTLAIARFGLLAMYSYLLFHHLSIGNPITAHLSSWYAKSTIFVFVFITSLAIYGFYTSLAGQRLFKGKLLED